MIIGTTKEPHHPDTGSRFYAGAGRLPHQNRSRLDSGNLASIVRHCHGYRRHYSNLPHLETQA